jgi:hypothetical protein
MRKVCACLGTKQAAHSFDRWTGSRIGWIEQLKVQSNATVDLSASGFFEAHQRRAFPLSGARLLTMEWE